MKNIPLLWLLFLLNLWSCQQEAEQHTPLWEADLTSTFLIDWQRDTILQTKNGSFMELAANTFSKHQNGKVELKITEILSKAEMIQYRMSTQTVKGDVLESGGMLYLETFPKQELNKEISIQFKSDAFRADMMLFAGERSKDGFMHWKNPTPIATNIAQEAVLEGELLFEKHCRMCHDKGLRKDLTGPALGNVHLFREKEWLLEFTKNSQKMINEGDSLASCLWLMWQPTVMTGFEGILSDQQILNIYTFLENESLVQRIDSNEVKYVVSCDRIRDPDAVEEIWTTVINTNQGTSIFQDTFFQSNLFGLDSAASSNVAIDSISLQYEYLHYKFDMQAFTWYNVDRLVKELESETEMIEFDEIEVHLQAGNENEESLQTVNLVYKDRNIVLGLYPKERNVFYLKSFNGPIKLPNEPAFFLATETTKQRVFLGELALDFNSPKTYSIEMVGYDWTAYLKMIDRY